jgi:hypothetical protein
MTRTLFTFYCRDNALIKLGKMEGEVNNVLLNNSSYELIEAENLGKNINIQWI